MTNDNFTFNANASGNAQVNQGQTVNATQTNIGGASMDASQFFALLRKELADNASESHPHVAPATHPELGPANDLDKLDELSIKPLEAAATNPKNNVKHGVSLEYIAGYFERLKPYASYILRVAAAGGDELIKKNAVIATIVRMAQEAIK